MTLVEYFFLAVFAFLEGDHAAFVAAISAGMTVSNAWRPKMLIILAAGFRDSPCQQVDELVSLLNSKSDWGSTDRLYARNMLGKADREYYSAISNWRGQADPSVFYRRHPELRSKAVTVSTMVSAFQEFLQF